MQLLHFFRKDMRRLWWEIAVSLGLLVVLTRMDAWRADYMPDPIEGWLNLLLPFTWSYLIALVVLEDPLVGDRQFWVAIPCRWRALLSAKLLFTLAFIHGPYLVASAIVLSARDFAPWLYIPQLLWKQLLLLTLITLPAIALATVVRNIAQFMLIAVILASAAVFADTPGPWIHVDEVRAVFSLGTLVTGATGVCLLQYSRRFTARARAAGILAVVAAVSIYMLLPLEASASLRCSVFPASPGAAPFSIRLSQRNEPLPEAFRRIWSRPSKQVAIPVEATGAPSAPLITRFAHLSTEIVSSDGETVRAAAPTRAAPFEKIPLQAWLRFADEKGPWLLLSMSNAVHDRLKTGAVTIRGRAIANVSLAGAETAVPLGGSTTLPSGGHCSSRFTEGPSYEEMLKVHCEDPRGLSRFTHIRLTDQAGMVWANRFGGGTWSVYPRNTWLSPLHRRDVFYNLVPDEVAQREGNRWLVPRSVAGTAKVTVMPEINEGCTVFNYELPNIELSKYAAQ